MLISTVLGGIMFRLELNPSFGVIPYYLGKLGYTAQLLDADHALATTVLIDVWQWTSFIFLISFAGLKSLPGEPFEAARVYGANAWQTFRYVTLPLLKPVLMIAVIFRMMDAFKALRSYLHAYVRRARQRHDHVLYPGLQLRLQDGQLRRGVGHGRGATGTSSSRYPRSS